MIPTHLKLSLKIVLNSEEKMEKKKEYVAPEVEMVELKAQISLLDGSDLGEGDEVGFAPFKQDPLA